MHRYGNRNTEMNASSDRYSHTYIHTYIYQFIQTKLLVHIYIYTYVDIYKYIILYKCSWTRVVLTSFLISLSAPWLTRYSTISLCPLAAAHDRSPPRLVITVRGGDDECNKQDGTRSDNRDHHICMHTRKIMSL